MATPTTYIKLDRNIQRWRWYTNANTMRVFLHLLLNANIEDHDFEKITVHRGQLVSSIGKIAEALELSPRNVRTAIEHLKSTNEMTHTAYPKYSLFTILNYDLYQSVSTSKSTDNRQASDKQSTSNRQQLKNIRTYKEYKNEKNNIGSALPSGNDETSAPKVERDWEW